MICLVALIDGIEIGTPIGPYDLLIAGQARRRSAVLVTANTGEFARVPGAGDRGLGGGVSRLVFQTSQKRNRSGGPMYYSGLVIADRPAMWARAGPDRKTEDAAADDRDQRRLPPRDFYAVQAEPLRPLRGLCAAPLQR
jgi:hypothetical protein